MGELKLLMTKEIEQEILSLLEQGLNITQISNKIGISNSTINRHRIAVPLFDELVSRARTIGVEILADQLQEVPDTYADVNKARLKCDVLKFIIQHRDPKNWSDRIDVNVTATVDIRGALEAAKSRVREVLDISKTQLIDNSTTIVDSATGLQPGAEIEATKNELDYLLD